MGPGAVGCGMLYIISGTSRVVDELNQVGDRLKFAAAASLLCSARSFRGAVQFICIE
jgi:hypothetical protein